MLAGLADSDSMLPDMLDRLWRAMHLHVLQLDFLQPIVKAVFGRRGAARAMPCPFQLHVDKLLEKV